jgi:ATP-binding cassette subfamily B protein
MVSQYYDVEYTVDCLRKLNNDRASFLSFADLIFLGKKIGIAVLAVNIDINKLINIAPLPCILHWHKSHFVVLYKIEGDIFYIANPSSGLKTYDKLNFIKQWSYNDTNGYALLLEPEIQSAQTL